VRLGDAGHDGRRASGLIRLSVIAAVTRIGNDYPRTLSNVVRSMGQFEVKCIDLKDDPP
jgi:hypothetical protein